MENFCNRSPSLDLIQNLNFIPKDDIKKINFDVNKGLFFARSFVTNELNKLKTIF